MMFPKLRSVLPQAGRLCQVLTLLFLVPLLAYGQAGSDRNLSELLPLIFNEGPPPDAGPGIVLPNRFHSAHFRNSSTENLTPFNQRLATQLTQLPIASPASGFVYNFDAATGTYSRSAQTFGPIITERSETIGKRRLYIGFSYQYFDFDDLDGIDLQNFPSVFGHSDTPEAIEGQIGDPAYVEGIEADVITTSNAIRLRMSQYTTFVTYGLTNRFDVSLAIPMLTAEMTVKSDATIQRLGTSEFSRRYADDPRGPDFFLPHTFRRPPIDQTTASFSSPRTASTAKGIGDLTVRVKGTVKQWENGGIAAAADVRFPTGDERDFLGAGSAGFRPFLILSHGYRRIGTHVNLGYLWNGDSILGGDVLAERKGNLPGQLTFGAGVDIGVTEDFSLALDYLGARVGEAERLVVRTFQAQPNIVYPNTTTVREAFSLNTGSVGFKINLGRRVLFTMNALIALDSNGLRDHVTPLIGLSFTP